jgi:small conductance mechanosensitive channel
MADFWRNFLDSLYKGLPKSAELARFLIGLVEVVVIVGVSLLLARLVKHWASQLLGRARVSANVLALAGNAAFVLVILLGVTWLLGVFGASWTAVVASLSVVTVAVSVALQDVLKNLVAGIYILLEQPFKIGDQIAVKGISGQVEGIDIRTTIIRTNEGLQVLIPNTIVFSDILTNRSAYDTHKVSLQLKDIRVPFTDLSRLVNDALAPFEEIDHAPAPQVKLKAIENGVATVTLDYWQRGSAPILPDVLSRLQDVFPNAAITIISSGDMAAPQPTG